LADPTEGRVNGHLKLVGVNGDAQPDPIAVQGLDC
jgi:hypothetical protein